MSQILVDRAELLVVHPSNRAPGHLLAERDTVGIDAGAHGSDELLTPPLLYKTEVGSYRTELALHAARQASTVAFATILMRQDVLAVLHKTAR